MRTARRLWPLALIAAAIMAAYLLRLDETLSWQGLAAHQAEWRGWIADHPVAGAFAYVAIYAGVVALSIPAGGLFSVTAGWLFGPILGAALAVTGASIGAALLFLLARSTLGAALAERARPLVERLRPGLERDGFSYLLALRLMPVVPFWLSNLAPALLGMRFGPYAVATVLGIIPATSVLAGVGSGLGEVLSRGERPDLSILVSTPVLLPLMGLALLSLLPIGWRRWRARHV